jgi:hypothetical protein
MDRSSQGHGPQGWLEVVGKFRGLQKPASLLRWRALCPVTPTKGRGPGCRGFCPTQHSPADLRNLACLHAQSKVETEMAGLRQRYGAELAAVAGGQAPARLKRAGLATREGRL